MKRSENEVSQGSCVRFRKGLVISGRVEQTLPGLVSIEEYFACT